MNLQVMSPDRCQTGDQNFRRKRDELTESDVMTVFLLKEAKAAVLN